MTDIGGATALITGGAGGIGLLTARQLAARGARVALWDIDETAVKAAAATLPGGPHHAEAVDITNREQVQEGASGVRTALGPVDVLCNNAGVMAGRSLTELSDAEIERTFAVNTLALFWVTRAFLPSMLERRHGHVVTIASASGLIGVANLVDYAASKHAAMGFDESLRMELRRTGRGVRTTVVCPFYVRTPLTAGATSRFPRLLPILEPTDVAEKIVEAVERNRRRIVMPWLVKAIPMMRMLPVPAFDAIADVLGVNSSMDEFVGRGDS